MTMQYTLARSYKDTLTVFVEDKAKGWEIAFVGKPSDDTIDAEIHISYREPIGEDEEGLLVFGITQRKAQQLLMLLAFHGRETMQKLFDDAQNELKKDVPRVNPQ